MNAAQKNEKQIALLERKDHCLFNSHIKITHNLVSSSDDYQIALRDRIEWIEEH